MRKQAKGEGNYRGEEEGSVGQERMCNRRPIKGYGVWGSRGVASNQREGSYREGSRRAGQKIVGQSKTWRLEATSNGRVGRYLCRECDKRENSPFGNGNGLIRLDRRRK